MKKQLQEYRKKRDFEVTPEPAAKLSRIKENPLIFVVHKHQASHLHYDLRLEAQGVLISWAVPKGPSLNPVEKHLAIRVEDHPFEYRTFEGNIPEGEYGAGSVMIWDEGTYEIPGAQTKKEAEDIFVQGLNKGHVEFMLHGKKLQGNFVLIKTHFDQNPNAWLLIKVKDEFASKKEITRLDRSVQTGRSMEEIKSENIPTQKDDMPEVIHPMLATLVKEPFDRKGWLFEIKWDGYRAITFLQNQEVKIYSRNQELFNARFPKIVNELKKIAIESAIFDGEIVVLDEQGRSHFQLMQNYQSTPQGYLAYYIFDLLYLNGQDLRQRPSKERKILLHAILQQANLETIRYSDHVEEKGIVFFAEAAKHHLEGIIGKNGNSAYVMRRSKEWVKVKTKLRQEFVIGGFTPPKGSRKQFGALLVGFYQGKDFIYAGHVGGGFSDRLLTELYQQLLPLIQEKCPFKSPLKSHSEVNWVVPKLVCEVEFAEWTDEGILRQPIFQGLRIDKKPKSVKREI